MEQAEVGIHRGGVVHAHPAVRAAGPEGFAPHGVELGRAAGAAHIPHPRLHFLEEKVEGAPVALVGLLRLGERQQRHEARERAVRRRAVVDEISDERDVEEPLGVLPEGVACMLLVACGVVDEAGDELQDVGLVPDVRDGVVVEGLREVHGIEGEHLVAALVEHATEAR